MKIQLETIDIKEKGFQQFLTDSKISYKITKKLTHNGYPIIIYKGSDKAIELLLSEYFDMTLDDLM